MGGGPEGSGGVNRKFIYCAFSDLLIVGVFINNQSRLFVETVHTIIYKERSTS
jgi:hypothetical protein